MNKDATLFCFFRCSNNQAQRLAGRDFVTIMVPSTIFLLWFWLTKAKLLFKDLIQCSCRQQGGEFGQMARPSLWNIFEGGKENRVREIDRQSDSGRNWVRSKRKRGGDRKKKRFIFPMTNWSWKFAFPLSFIAIHIWKADCCDNWFDGPAWVEALLGIAGLRDAKKGEKVGMK
jgi:hypothetical protein